MKIFTGVLVVLILGITNTTLAQETEKVLPKESKYKDPSTKTWINTYGNIRISKRLFWVAQTHFRFAETEDTPFVGQVA